MKRQLCQPVLVISIGIGIGKYLQPFGGPYKDTIGKTGFIVNNHRHMTVIVIKWLSQVRIVVFELIGKGFGQAIHPLRDISLCNWEF